MTPPRTWARPCTSGGGDDPTVARTDASYTVNAWVRLDSVCDDPDDACWTARDREPGRRGAAWRQRERHAELRYNGSPEALAVRRRRGRRGDGRVGRGGREHVDPAHRRLRPGRGARLYVNGQLQDEVAPTSGGAPHVRLRHGAPAWCGRRGPGVGGRAHGDQVQDRLVDPAPNFEPIHQGQLTRFNAGSDHLVTTGAAHRAAIRVPARFRGEYRHAGTRTIYSCRKGASDYFLSCSTACEGQTWLGVVGGFYTGPGPARSAGVSMLDPEQPSLRLPRRLRGADDGVPARLHRPVLAPDPVRQQRISVRAPQLDLPGTARYQAEWSLGIMFRRRPRRRHGPAQDVQRRRAGGLFSSIEQGCEGGPRS